MKAILAGALAALITPCALAQVGVSIGINQPGVYGRINIGDIPPPALILPQPVIIQRPAVYVERRPIYLYVPPTHQQDWGRYCGRYSACGQPVYFVQEQWVRERYAHEHPGWGPGGRRGHDDKHWDKHQEKHDKKHFKEERKQFKEEQKHFKEEQKGHGKGHGKGHKDD